ncbi:hypothetical protein MtrunA17_Chr5g0401841 [Medicago truncatula]|uniref:Uncharacterized protein n=1 Tax=Medicago truncatula TaxID=3880 RepID=A0A396HKZ6_MEDTR|nr:hypothetical protein MtrunA17_Chr5g0401841 [Medicago truncatula]
MEMGLARIYFTLWHICDTKLRYLSYVMDVPTPTTDCLNLVYDLLEPPVITRKNSNASLSCLENETTRRDQG